MTNIDRWLKANRCWRREHNILHAHYMLSHAAREQERAQWQLILERLEG